MKADKIHSPILRHYFTNWTAHLINTLLQQGVSERTMQPNRFNGLSKMWKAVKTAWAFTAPRLTPLKWGVNEKPNPSTSKIGEKMQHSPIPWHSHTLSLVLLDSFGNVVANCDVENFECERLLSAELFSLASNNYYP
jgi:hypothetical protein